MFGLGSQVFQILFSTMPRANLGRRESYKFLYLMGRVQPTQAEKNQTRFVPLHISWASRQAGKSFEKISKLNPLKTDLPSGGYQITFCIEISLLPTTLAQQVLQGVKEIFLLALFSDNVISSQILTNFKQFYYSKVKLFFFRMITFIRN